MLEKYSQPLNLKVQNVLIDFKKYKRCSFRFQEHKSNSLYFMLGRLTIIYRLIVLKMPIMVTLDYINLENLHQ